MGPTGFDQVVKLSVLANPQVPTMRFSLPLTASSGLRLALPWLTRCSRRSPSP